jgi:protein phosphatase
MMFLFLVIIIFMNRDLPAQCHRLAVISDIHGNLPAFEAVMAKLNTFAPIERILVAGDMIGGPHDDVILRRLRELDAVMVLGNNECAVLELEQDTAPDYHYAAQQFSLIRWCWKQLSPEMLAMLRAVPQQRIFNLPGCDPICVVHGSPRDVWELTSPYENRVAFDEIMELMGEPVAVFGHTHRAWFMREQGRLALNPGAVSIPEGDYLEGGTFRAGPVGARFAILEWDGQQWNPHFHIIPYDLHALRRANAETGFLREVGPLARVFLLDTLTGQPVWMEFFDLARQLAREAGAGDLPYIPDEAWLRAGEQFAWEKWEAII